MSPCFNSFMEAFQKIALVFLFSILPFTLRAQDNILNGHQADSISRQLSTLKSSDQKFGALLKLAWYQILKNGELKVDLDSAKAYLLPASRMLKTIHSPELLGLYYLVYSDYYNESHETSSANVVLENALDYLKGSKDKFLLGTAYLEKMYRIPLSQNTANQKILLVEQAATAFRSIPNKRKLGDCVRLLADLHSIFAIDEKVIRELDSAKTLYQEAKSGDWQQLYSLYARYYGAQENAEKTLEATLSALNATSQDNMASQAELTLNASAIYEHLKDFKKSLFYAKKAIRFAKIVRDTDAMYNAALFAIAGYDKLGDPKSGVVIIEQLESAFPVSGNNRKTVFYLIDKILAYTNVHDYKKGQPAFDQIKKMIENPSMGNGEREFCYKPMVTFAVMSGNYGMAEALLKDWEETAAKLGPTAFRRQRILNGRLQLDTVKKDYKAGVRDLLAMRILADSIFSQTQTKQLKEIEVRSQVERQENENKIQRQKILLLTNQQKLARAELRATAVTRNIILISALCLTLIAVLIYRQYRIGRKSNRVITEKNKRLELLLDENEWLMKEVHHRVKNNLQIVTSLLNSQSAYLEEGMARDAILVSKGRVESISLIHQKLYRTDKQCSIFMPEYIKDLVVYLEDCCVREQEVEFNVLVDPIQLDVSDAVPIGLVINESVTNAIKHAFIPKYGNTIDISLTKAGDELTLTIKDNGKGINIEQIGENSSFGLLLIKGLVQDLNGNLQMFNNGGAVIRLAFNSKLSLPHVLARTHRAMS